LLVAAAILTTGIGCAKKTQPTLPPGVDTAQPAAVGGLEPEQEDSSQSAQPAMNAGEGEQDVFDVPKADEIRSDDDLDRLLKMLEDNELDDEDVDDLSDDDLDEF